MKRPLLAVSLGCPSGIGPEVPTDAGIDALAFARVLLVGDLAIVERALSKRKKKSVKLRAIDRPEDLGRGELGVLSSATELAIKYAPWGRPTKEGGAAQYAWFEEAMTLVAQGYADALVTGPVSKAAVQSGGVRGFLGHTEALAARFAVEEVTMAFAARRFTTALVTTHLPLSAVPDAVTEARVGRAIRDLAAFLERRSKAARGRKQRPRILVTGLNPHAGESGKIGTEESRIARAIAKCRSVADLEGPLAAEAVFRRAARGDVDGVVAMYHDQATIPTKLLSFGEAVNVTLGLPIIRTSVDHGTGYDIAGKGKADPAGMLEAMRLAAELSYPRRGTGD